MSSATATSRLPFPPAASLSRHHPRPRCLRPALTSVALRDMSPPASHRAHPPRPRPLQLPPPAPTPLKVTTRSSTAKGRPSPYQTPATTTTTTTTLPTTAPNNNTITNNNTAPTCKSSSTARPRSRAPAPKRRRPQQQLNVTTAFAEPNLPKTSRDLWLWPVTSWYVGRVAASDATLVSGERVIDSLRPHLSSTPLPLPLHYRLQWLRDDADFLIDHKQPRTPSAFVPYAVTPIRDATACARPSPFLNPDDTPGAAVPTAKASGRRRGRAGRKSSQLQKDPGPSLSAAPQSLGKQQVEGPPHLQHTGIGSENAEKEEGAEGTTGKHERTDKESDASQRERKRQRTSTDPAIFIPTPKSSRAMNAGGQLQEHPPPTNGKTSSSDPKAHSTAHAQIHDRNNVDHANIIANLSDQPNSNNITHVAAKADNCSDSSKTRPYSDIHNGSPQLRASKDGIPLLSPLPLQKAFDANNPIGAYFKSADPVVYPNPNNPIFSTSSHQQSDHSAPYSHQQQHQQLVQLSASTIGAKLKPVTNAAAKDSEAKTEKKVIPLTLPLTPPKAFATKLYMEQQRALQPEHTHDQQRCTNLQTGNVDVGSCSMSEKSKHWGHENSSVFRKIEKDDAGPTPQLRQYHCQRDPQPSHTIPTVFSTPVCLEFISDKEARLIASVKYSITAAVRKPVAAERGPVKQEQQHGGNVPTADTVNASVTVNTKAPQPPVAASEDRRKIAKQQPVFHDDVPMTNQVATASNVEKDANISTNALQREASEPLRGSIWREHEPVDRFFVEELRLGYRMPAAEGELNELQQYVNMFDDADESDELQRDIAKELAQMARMRERTSGVRQKAHAALEASLREQATIDDLLEEEISVSARLEEISRQRNAAARARAAEARAAKATRERRSSTRTRLTTRKRESLSSLPICTTRNVRGIGAATLNSICPHGESRPVDDEDPKKDQVVSDDQRKNGLIEAPDATPNLKNCRRRARSIGVIDDDEEVERDGGEDEEEEEEEEDDDDDAVIEEVNDGDDDDSECEGETEHANGVPDTKKKRRKAVDKRRRKSTADDGARMNGNGNGADHNNDNDDDGNETNPSWSNTHNLNNHNSSNQFHNNSNSNNDHSNNNGDGNGGSSNGSKPDSPEEGCAATVAADDDDDCEDKHHHHHHVHDHEHSDLHHHHRKNFTVTDARIESVESPVSPIQVVGVEQDAATKIMQHGRERESRKRWNNSGSTFVAS